MIAWCRHQVEPGGPVDANSALNIGRIQPAGFNGITIRASWQYSYSRPL
jgi:hypothetical protein